MFTFSRQPYSLLRRVHLEKDTLVNCLAFYRCNIAQVILLMVDELRSFSKHRLADHGLRAKSSVSPAFVNFYWNTALPLCLYIVCGSFGFRMAELSICNRDQIEHNTWNVLAYYRKTLPTPVLEYLTRGSSNIVLINFISIIFKE